MTAIGKMRFKVKVYTITQGQPDGIGGYTTTKDLSGTFWAAVKENNGSRTGQDNTVINRTALTVTMRTGSFDLTTENIIEYNGIDLTINSITKDPLSRFTVCECISDGS